MLYKGKKVLCKKVYENLIINKYYKISAISKNLIMIDNKKRNTIHSVLFTLNIGTYSKFYDYFYTDKEERKLKLERLNNVKHK